MLLQFLVENHRSFRDETILSMVLPAHATAPDKWLMNGPDGCRVLRCAAIYGANASGKSNLVGAFATLRQLVVEGTRDDEALPHAPFKLDASRSKPTRFEVEAYLADHAHHGRYSYGISFDARRVHAEWLYWTRDGAEESLMFERTADPDTSTSHKFEFGAGFDSLRHVADGVRDNQPLLAEAKQRRSAGALRYLIDWFAASEIHWPQSALHWSALLHGDGLRPSASAFLARYDTGIRMIDVSTSVVQSIPSEPEAAAALKSYARRMSPLRVKDDKLEKIDLAFQHEGPDGVAPLDWSEESDGTQRLLNISPVFNIGGWGTSRERASPVFIDELDRSLHSLVSQRLVADFVDLAADPALGGTRELIVTTHDASLLRRGVLPVAAVRFVEKSQQGLSVLYPLTDYDPEHLSALASTLEGSYLEGRFGAVPAISDAPPAPTDVKDTDVNGSPK